MYLNNILLHKADGTIDTLQSFDSKLPEVEGTAKAVLIKANADGTNGTAAIKVAKAVSGKMLVSVQQGVVTANFNAATAGRASITLMNSLGQVIARKNFEARHGANRVSLETGYHGTAFLVIRQGSQKFSKAIQLK